MTSTTATPGGSGVTSTTTTPGGSGVTSTTAPSVPTGSMTPVCAPAPRALPTVGAVPSGPPINVTAFLAQTGKGTGPLVLAGLFAVLCGIFLTRCEPDAVWAAVGPRVTTMSGRLLRLMPDVQPSDGEGAWVDEAPDEPDPFPALSFVPVVVEEGDTEAPMLVRGMVAPDTHPRRPPPAEGLFNPSDAPPAARPAHPGRPGPGPG